MDIKRHCIYDREKESEVREQYHLLGEKEKNVAELIFLYSKIINVYDGCGMVIAQTPGDHARPDYEEISTYYKSGKKNVRCKDRYISSFF